MKSYFLLSVTLAVAALTSTLLFCIEDIGTEAITEEQERSLELDRVIAASHARYEAMTCVVDELAEGTRSLSSAMKETSDEYEDDELTIRVTREKFGGDSKDEVICRHLMYRVAVLLKHSPRYHAVLQRLEREFAELYPHAKQPPPHDLERYDLPPHPAL